MKTALFLILSILCLTPPLFAGVFDLPLFLEPGRFSVGIEPEVIISNGVGAGVNFKPKYGVNNLLNAQGVIGFGTGDRQFRLGAIGQLEWFPDVDRQPGIATPIEAIYYNYKNKGMMFVGSSPMIYKTFDGQGGAYTPFISTPIGWSLKSEGVEGFMQATLGTMFKLAGQEQFRFSLEAGFNIFGAYSYISGGATYYH